MLRFYHYIRYIVYGILFVLPAINTRYTLYCMRRVPMNIRIRYYSSERVRCRFIPYLGGAGRRSRKRGYYMFIENLQRLMRENGVSKRRLAQELGFGINRIRYWEKHGNIPGGDVLLRLARYFGVSAESLLEDSASGGVQNSDIGDILSDGSGKNSDTVGDVEDIREYCGENSDISEDSEDIEQEFSENSDSCADVKSRCHEVGGCCVGDGSGRYEDSGCCVGDELCCHEDSDCCAGEKSGCHENSDCKCSSEVAGSESSDIQRDIVVDDVENSDITDITADENIDRRKLHIRFLTDDEWARVLRLRTLNELGRLKAAQYLDDLTGNPIYSSRSVGVIRKTFGGSDSDSESGGTRAVRTAAHDGSFGMDDGFKARAVSYTRDDLRAIKSLDDVDDLD